MNKYWKCQCQDKEFNHIQQESSLLLKEDERNERKKFKGQRSLKKWCYFKWQNGDGLPDTLYVASLADVIIKEEKIALMSKLAQILNYSVKRRNEISDYRRRLLPKLRIGRYTYYLMPNTSP